MTQFGKRTRDADTSADNPTPTPREIWASLSIPKRIGVVAFGALCLLGAAVGSNDGLPTNAQAARSLKMLGERCPRVIWVANTTDLDDYSTPLELTVGCLYPNGDIVRKYYALRR